MGELEYMGTEDGQEFAMKVGSVIGDLDEAERRLLWEALTICVLGPIVRDDPDLLHVMFGKRDDGQYHAQVDRKTDRGIERLMSWHGEIVGADQDMLWRVRSKGRRRA